MDDRNLLAALIAGDPHSMEGVYRAYADQLYTYCHALLRDPQAAADALHDMFVLASERSRELAEPERLGSWLYALVRNECRWRLRGRDRYAVAAPPAAESLPADEPEPPELPAAELSELVWSASGGLDTTDLEMFELVVRHRLPVYEVSAVLGVADTQVQTRLAHARTQLERALGALLAARAGERNCPRLAQVLRKWDGRLTRTVRERVIRHLDSCGSCVEDLQQQLSPAALLSAYRDAPFLATPASLWPRLRLYCFDPGVASEREAIVARAGRFDPATGFPRSLPARHQRRPVVTAAAVLAAVLLAGGTGAIIRMAALTSDEPAPPPPVAALGPRSWSPTATATPSTTATPTATASVLRGVTAVPTSPEPEPEPQPEPPARTPAWLSVDAAANPDCSFRLWYRVEVTANADQPLAAARLFVATDSETQSYGMNVDGSTAFARTERMMESQFEWWVEVTSEKQQQAATDPGRVVGPCD